MKAETEAACNSADGNKCYWYTKSSPQYDPSYIPFKGDENGFCWPTWIEFIHCSSFKSPGSCPAGCRWKQECEDPTDADDGCKYLDQTGCVQKDGCWYQEFSGMVTYVGANGRVVNTPVTPECNNCISGKDDTNEYKYWDKRRGQVCSPVGSMPKYGIVSLSGSVAVGNPIASTAGTNKCAGGKAEWEIFGGAMNILCQGEAMIKSQIRLAGVTANDLADEATRKSLAGAIKAQLGLTGDEEVKITAVRDVAARRRRRLLSSSVNVDFVVIGIDDATAASLVSTAQTKLAEPSFTDKIKVVPALAATTGATVTVPPQPQTPVAGPSSASAVGVSLTVVLLVVISAFLQW
jgi:hypothetical protein